MQNIVIAQKSSSVYLMEAMVGTGPHASCVRPFIRRSPQEHLDFEGVPNGIWISLLKRERDMAFLQEHEPNVIVAEFGIV